MISRRQFFSRCSQNDLAANSSTVFKLIKISSTSNRLRNLCNGLPIVCRPFCSRLLWLMSLWRLTSLLALILAALLAFRLAWLPNWERLKSKASNLAPSPLDASSFSVSATLPMLRLRMAEMELDECSRTVRAAQCSFRALTGIQSYPAPNSAVLQSALYACSAKRLQRCPPEQLSSRRDWTERSPFRLLGVRLLEQSPTLSSSATTIFGSGSSRSGSHCALNCAKITLN